MKMLTQPKSRVQPEAAVQKLPPAWPYMTADPAFDVSERVAITPELAGAIGAIAGPVLFKPVVPVLRSHSVTPKASRSLLVRNINNLAWFAVGVCLAFLILSWWV